MREQHFSPSEADMERANADVNEFLAGKEERLAKKIARQKAVAKDVAERAKALAGRLRAPKMDEDGEETGAHTIDGKPIYYPDRKRY